MLTGQRRDEIGDLRWSEIVDGAIVLPAGAHQERPAARHTAVATGHSGAGRLPGNGARNVFGQGEEGFSGFAGARERLDDASGLPAGSCTISAHVATRMADLGVLPHVIEAVLNHISGHKAGVAGIYNRSDLCGGKARRLDPVG